MNLNPKVVLSVYQNLTGIRLRFISHNMESQAIDFCNAGFTLTELESVVRWTQQQIAAGKNGFSHLSLQFHIIFGKYGSGNDFETFQTRLAMAQKTVRLRPEPKAVATSKTVDAQGMTFTVLESCRPVSTDSPDMREQVSAQLAELRKSMGGKVA